MKRQGFARVTPGIGPNVGEEELRQLWADGDASIKGTLIKDLYVEPLDSYSGTFDAQSCAYENARFEGCTFDHVDFSDSTFADVEFKSCRFIACEMSRSWHNRVDFASCSAPGISFEKGRLTGVSVADSQMSYANLSGCSVIGMRVRSTNLSEASFARAKLLKLELADVDLTRAAFHGAPLGGVDLSECRIAGIGLSANLREIRGAIIDETQAIDLMGYLGVKIRGYEQ